MECVSETKKIIDRQVRLGRCLYDIGYKDNYHQNFFWTNENVWGYLYNEDFKNKFSALTVLATGDQAFNLLYKGINNIDTFDNNKLTEYFALGLKRAIILKYNYNDFLKTTSKFFDIFTPSEEINEILLSLLPYMEKKHADFWKEIIDYNFLTQKNAYKPLNLMHMLFYFEKDEEFFLDANSYLFNKQNYELTRNRLKKANITYKAINARFIGKIVHEKYDCILLSNILDYFYNYWGHMWDYRLLNIYEKELLSLLNEKGILFLQYIFCYSDKKFAQKPINSKTYEDYRSSSAPVLFYNSNILESDIKDEILEYIPNIGAGDDAILKLKK